MKHLLLLVVTPIALLGLSVLSAAADCGWPSCSTLTGLALEFSYFPAMWIYTVLLIKYYFPGSQWPITKIVLLILSPLLAGLILIPFTLIGSSIAG